MERECSGCKFLKPLKDFDKKSKNGNKYRSKCKPCRFLENKKYKKNKEKVFEYNKKYYNENKEREKKRSKDYKIENKEKVREYEKKYLANNREELRTKRRPYIREYNKKRRKKDLNFRLKESLRSRLNIAVRKVQKAGSAVDDLGCSIEFLKFHLESLFQPGMTWDNYGRNGWHIDHIIPLLKFDLSKKEELKKACHYTNLQPLWAIDNLKKGSK